MFPAKLDGARVLWYTGQGDYGAILCTNGEVYDRRAYFAVCQYPDGDGYYLFSCNEAFEVISDCLRDDVAQCKRDAERWHAGLIWHAADAADE